MKKYYTNDGSEFIVLAETREFRKESSGKSRPHTFWEIQYTETGYTTKVYKANATKGKMKDPYRISVFGKGYCGVFKKVEHWKQAKQLWQNMLKRCYCEKDTKGYFGVSTVDSRWLCFANFLEDLPKLDNFDKWLAGQNGGKGKYNLDKDLRFPKNKVYSFDACSFVTEYLNKSEGARNGKPFGKNPKIK